MATWGHGNRQGSKGQEAGFLISLLFVCLFFFFFKVELSKTVQNGRWELSPLSVLPRTSGGLVRCNISEPSTGLQNESLFYATSGDLQASSLDKCWSICHGAKPEVRCGGPFL